MVLGDTGVGGLIEWVSKVGLGTGLRRKGRTGSTSFSASGEELFGGTGGGKSLLTDTTDGAGEGTRDGGLLEGDGLCWGNSIDGWRCGILVSGGRELCLFVAFLGTTGARNGDAGAEAALII
jgi:hypothetical protein